MVIVKSGFVAWKPAMFVSVAFSISMMNFSPLSGVTRLIVNFIPPALRLSMRMARKFRNSSVGSGFAAMAVSATHQACRCNVLA